MKSTKSRVFVTGANGMLGTHITKTLLNDGYDVTAMVYPGTKTDTINTLPIRILQGDITQPLPFEQWLLDCDYVIHVAASTQIWPKRDPKIWAINHTGTMNLVKAAQKLNIKRFVHIGSASSFTPKNIQFEGNEAVQDYNDAFGLDYIDSKTAIQRDLLKLHEETNFPVVVLNPTFMVGEYDSGPTSGRMILNLMKGGLQGYTAGGKNLVYTGDVARAAVNAMTMGRTGQCYIAAGENYSFKAMHQLLRESIGVKITSLKIPHWFTLLIGFMLSCISRITNKAPKLSFTMARISRASTFYNTAKAREELNMPKTSLHYAVRACAHWFVERGYAKPNPKFKGKTVVVTGSTQGVGHSLAHALIAQGANVVLNGRSNAKANVMNQAFAYAPSSYQYIPADVCEESECETLIEQAKTAFGRVDYLVNNAGMSSYGDLEENSGEVIRQVLHSNVLGAFYLTKLALPQLKQNNGGVLFISSLAALNGLGGHAIYSAAKVAMVSLAQSLKKELSKTKVHIGYACLGFTENDEGKKTLNPFGELEDVPKRPGIRPMPRHLAVHKIIRQLESREYRSIHSAMGKSFYLISRFSESLANMILLKGYKAEKAFLESLHKMEAHQKAPQISMA